MKKYATFLFILITLVCMPAYAQTYELVELGELPDAINVVEANESTGQIMVGGAFNSSAGTNFAKFAVIENDEFVNPGSGLPTDASMGIMDLAESHNILYAGSASTDPTWRLSKKNAANNWESTGIEVDGPIYALDTLSNGDLIVLGDFETPYADAFVYDGENAMPLNGFSIEGTPIGISKFNGKYYINYLSMPQDYKNLFIWDESCQCESASEINIPANFIVDKTASTEEELYITLWNFNEGDREFYKSTDGVFFNKFGTYNGTITDIELHNGLIYIGGSGMTQINNEDVTSTLLVYNPALNSWSPVGEFFWGIDDVDFLGDDLYIAYSEEIWVYREKNTTISVFDIEKNISIYPNPTSNYVTLEFENIFSQNIEIYNSLGEIVFTNEISRSEEKIILDVTDLPDGMYLVKSEALTGRFLKL